MEVRGSITQTMMVFGEKGFSSCAGGFAGGRWFYHSRDDGFNDEVVHVVYHLARVDTLLPEISPERLQTPANESKKDVQGHVCQKQGRCASIEAVQHHAKAWVTTSFTQTT